jgi:hypothetical protein
MPRVGLEPMIPMFKREKAALALDRAATVIGILQIHKHKILRIFRYPLSGLLSQQQPCSHLVIPASELTVSNVRNI